MRDRPEIPHEFVARHANAVVANHEFLEVRPPLDRDFKRRLGALRLIGQSDIAHLVERVGGVRDQFSNRDFLTLVQGMREQVEQLLDLGLKAELLRFLEAFHGAEYPS